MSKLPIAGFAAAVALFAVDQGAKHWITDVLGLNELTLAYRVTGFLNWQFVANRGVSLGLLHADSDAMRWALVVMTGLIATGVLVWMLRERNRVEQIALGSVMGGAIGNILDRVRLGYVVDFIDFHIGAWQPFLVFNTADVMITMGVLVLFARALLVRDKPRAERASVENSNA